MKRALILGLLALLCCALAGCAPTDPYKDVPNPIATITMKNGSAMRFELQLSIAPNTVANFTALANDGFYDGLKFHRVVPGALIQSGDPLGDGTGNAGHTIKGEFASNGVQNDLSHMRGVISMARREDKNSASSQFFIMQGNYPEYDGEYAAFGTAMDDETLSTIESIATQQVDGYYEPLQAQVIQSVRVNTHGYEFNPITQPIPDEG
jgi:peptidyl-prolyl cis-trans isomerase B (cyclophilin B)